MRTLNFGLNNNLGRAGRGSISVATRLPVTDFFNGFNLPGSTYSGGPTVVADNTGALVTSPADVLPIEGMRLTENGWVPYAIDMTSVYTSDPDFIGVLYDTVNDTWERVGSSRGMAAVSVPGRWVAMERRSEWKPRPAGEAGRGIP